MKTRILSIALAICVFLPLTVSAAYEPGPLLDDIKAAADKAAAVIEAQDTYSGWGDVLALASHGAAITPGKLPEESADTVPGLATTILVRAAAGKNPYESGLPYDLALRQAADGGFGSVNETVYAMLALNTTPGVYKADKAMEWLASQQLADGGFAYAGTAGDVDMTGMVLLVLRGDAAVRAADFLKSQMTDNGGFISPWSENKAENACSAAAAVSGLIAAGLPVDEKLKQNLLSFRLDDGSFCYEPGGKADMFSTQQALMALGDLIGGTGVFAGLTKSESKPFRDWDKIAVWAHNGVKTVFERDVMVGDKDRNFNPLSSFNRAELAVVASKMMGTSAEPVDQKLSDVKPGDWYYTHVTRVVQAGIMTPGGGSFGPYTPVTREEMALVLYTLLKLEPGTARPADAGDVGVGYMDAVSAMIDEGIMVGNGIIFMPKSKITRQEVATILAKIYA